ncbi:nucleotidyltransferase domain-containing protein [Nocardiopsis alba]|uniref:nucleotidyltransferase domain-containing protein n=1 Tax=Nocardiopsis alba TaxID=53437 RepID=UPI0033BA4FCA
MPRPAIALDRRIARLREIAEAEPRLEGVLLYGSWTQGEADEYSDIEAYLYVADEHAASFDGTEFVSRLAPLELAYTNLFGILAVVFDDLVRGEFHVETAGSAIPQIASWKGMIHLSSPETAVLLDRTGRLTQAVRPLVEPIVPDPGPTAERLVGELANWTLMTGQVLARGEYARAHAGLAVMIAPQQLKLARLLHGSTDHWLTPSRALEADLPGDVVERYRRTTGDTSPEEVRRTVRESWAWSRELSREAAARWGLSAPEELHERITGFLDRL